MANHKIMFSHYRILDTLIHFICKLLAYKIIYTALCNVYVYKHTLLREEIYYFACVYYE